MQVLLCQQRRSRHISGFQPDWCSRVQTAALFVEVVGDLKAQHSGRVHVVTIRGTEHTGSEMEHEHVKGRIEGHDLAARGLEGGSEVEGGDTAADRRIMRSIVPAGS